jgi:NAD(P)-dependent dehydrogenase (short-subunit alcohol dehydrogenase family)
MTERVVLVTGALAGIGRATAAAFARQGAAVVVSGRRDEDGKAFAAELRAIGAGADYLRADVSVEDDIQALVDGTARPSASWMSPSTTPASPAVPAN